ncbi:MAG: hypothetical protein B7X76_02195 [Azorhizobium sp. 39-67-5]|nr:MAG: hypothetical protein B7X76_02195 [Azorhizobium sp. 39-67-5]
MTALSKPLATPGALDAFRAVDFESTRNLKSVWRDVPYEVSDFHAGCVEEILAYFDRGTHDPEPESEPPAAFFPFGTFLFDKWLKKHNQA